MSNRPAWPWLKKPTSRPHGHHDLGYYQRRETEKAVLFDYQGREIWIPKKVLVWFNGHFMAPYWVIQTSLKFQQNRGKSTMTTEKPTLIYGTRLLYRFPYTEDLVEAQIFTMGAEATSETWVVETLSGLKRRDSLTYAEVIQGVEAYRAHKAEAKADNDNLNWNERARAGHAKNVLAGWWTATKPVRAVEPGDDLHGVRNTGELLMLSVSEVAEAAEGIDEQTDTPNLRYMDDKLPDRPMFEVELADTKIRLFDLSGAHQLDLDGARADILALGLEPIVNKAWFGVDHYLLTVVRELSSAMEGHRKNGPDLQIIGRKRFEVRIAMTLMWIDAIGSEYGLDVEGAIVAKEAFNAVREDHKMVNRMAAGGKAY